MANVEKEGYRQVINNSERFMLLRKRSCLQFSIVSGGGLKLECKRCISGGGGKLFSLARTSNAADKRG